MTRAIVTGALGKPAEIRVSKNGNQFATFTIRESLNGATRWWQVITFRETAIQTLKEMTVGEPPAVAGVINAEIYAQGAESRVSWRANVDIVLTARKPKRKPTVERAPGASSPERRTGRSIVESSWASPNPGGDFDGQLPL